MKATTVGIDLAKNLVQVHGVDERGRPVFRKQLKSRTTSRNERNAISGVCRS